MTVLALLIGTNPLPNLVTALWVARQPGIRLSAVRLYYTTPRVIPGATDLEADRGTGDIAEHLGDVLANALPGIPAIGKPLGDPISVAGLRDTIVQDITTDPETAGESAFHLSYTGGTKTMSRGLWLAGEKLARAGTSVTLSYLDDSHDLDPHPGRHALRLAELGDDGMIRTWSYSGGDLRHQIQIDRNRLLGIHGVRWHRTPAPSPEQSAHRTKLAEAIEAVRGSLGFDRAVVDADGWGVRRDSTELRPAQLAAVFGYQLLIGFAAVGPDFPPGIGNEARVKRVAFRALMLAGQLGGEEARAIITSDLGYEAARRVSEALVLDDRRAARRVTLLGKADVDDPARLQEAVRRLLGRPADAERDSEPARLDVSGLTRSAVPTLVVLQGGNPVPNWAAAQLYLTDHPILDPEQPERRLPRVGRVVIVTSHQQRSAAECLASVLDATSRRAGTSPPAVEIAAVGDPNDGIQVVEAISALGNEARLHLSYTGGTKMMAVHAARKASWATLSYLDAALHALSVEQDARGSADWTAPKPAVLKKLLPRTFPADALAGRVRHDLRLFVQPSLDDVVALHGWEPTPDRERRPEHRADDRALPDATTAMARWLTAEHPDALFRWRGAHWSALERLKANPYAATVTSWDGRKMQAVARALARDLANPAWKRFVQCGDWQALRYDPGHGVFDRHTVYRFLVEGSWLERVVQVWTQEWLDKRLGAARAALGLTALSRSKAYRSVEVRPIASAGQWVTPARAEAGWNERESLRPTAEIDVLALVGHQLVAISCTTDGDLIAEKGSEVWFRARQLGGDEARAIVVSLRQKTEARERELANEFGGVDRVGVINAGGIPGSEDGKSRLWSRLDKLVGWA